MSDLDDLDSMFPDPSPEDDVPELQTKGTFGEGYVWKNEPAPSTDLALCVVFQREHCTHCLSVNLSSLGFAVKRKHHSRNSVIEYQFVMESSLPLYVGLERKMKFYDKEVPICRCCNFSRGFEDEDS